MDVKRRKFPERWPFYQTVSVQVAKFSICILCNVEGHVVIHSTGSHFSIKAQNTYHTHSYLIGGQRSKVKATVSYLTGFFDFKKAYTNNFKMPPILHWLHRSSAPNVAAFKASLQQHPYLKRHKLFDSIDAAIHQCAWPSPAWWTACFSPCRAPEVRGKFTVLAREITLLKETSTSQWWWGAGSINRRVSGIWEVKACLNLSSVTL